MSHIKEEEEPHSEEDIMGSPIPSPDRKKFKMKIRGDCFLYTSFYMIKKWFLVLVAVKNLPQFQESIKKMFKFETKDKFFVIGIIFALPVLIPVACMFIALALLLLLLLILTFLLAAILLFLLILIIDLPLILVLLIQAFLFSYTLDSVGSVTLIDFTSLLFYLDVLLLIILGYNALCEVSNAADNMLYLIQHYQERKDESVLYGLFIIISILPQLLQIAITGIIAYISPTVILCSVDIISSLRAFAGLFIIIKANAFMMTFLRETKWHALHWKLFKYLEEKRKVNMIHVQADVIEKKIYDLKKEKIYIYKGWGFRYDKDFVDNIGMYIFKNIFKVVIFALMFGVFCSILYNFYS